MSNILKVTQDSRSEMLYLVTSKEKPSNQDAWWYVQVEDQIKRALFLQELKDGIKLTNYGVVLYSGWGTEPPEDVMQEIKERFG